MSATRTVLKNSVRSWLPVLVALMVGFLIANVERQPSTAQAEVRKTPSRTAFQSGAARSETLLREISATLKQIDTRLQRIERAAAAGNRPGQPAN